jgi:hypothetical protein
MKIIKIGYIALITVLFACGNSQSKGNDQEHGDHKPSKSELSGFAAPISPIIQNYILLKNALVASNPEETKACAESMLKEINKTDTSKFSSTQREIWDTKIEIIKGNAAHISETSEISHQRDHLNPLSEAMFELIKSFKGEKTLYYDFCPMANDNKGGYWLSETEEIENPYYGNDMLNCGEVIESVK